MSPRAGSHRRWSGASALAGWLAIPEPVVVEAAARAGFDWIGLDLQHGAWDLGTAFRGIQLADALGKPVLIRLPDEQLSLIPRVLDHGASGIVLAMASEPEVVAAAIERARYQPEGKRSYGGQRYGMRPEPSDPADVRPAIFAMIETRRGVEAVTRDRRDRGPGRDCMSARPTSALRSASAATVARRPSATPSPRLSRPATRTACRSPCTPSRRARPRWVEAGFDELVLTTDIELLRGAFAELIGSARTATESDGASVGKDTPPYDQRPDQANGHGRRRKNVGH